MEKIKGAAITKVHYTRYATPIVQVNNYGEPINTEEFIGNAYKKPDDTCSFVETKSSTISSDKSSTHFKCFPPSTEYYRLSIYTKNTEEIIVDIWKKKGGASMIRL